MKQFILATLFMAVSSITVSAQGDPWITKAYSELYNRQPTVKESIIKNYNNGSWNSYAELVSYIVTYNNAIAGSHIKGDPWIFKAYLELYNRIPIQWELNINNYNSGSWANYDELKKFITEYNNALVANKIKVIMATVKAATTLVERAAVFLENGKVVAANLISNDKGEIKATGGKEIAEKGISKLISDDGSTLIGNDAGSLTNLAGVQLVTTGYTLKSTDTKAIKTAGKTTMVIRK